MTFNYPQPPPNLGNSLVVNDATGATVPFAARVLTITPATGATLSEGIDKIISVTKTAYAAGTAQVLTVQFSGSTFVAGQSYKVGIRRNDTDQVVTFVVVAPTTSAADFATAVVAAVTNSANNGGIVSAAVVSSTKVSFTMIVDTGGIAASILTAGATITTPTTAYVASVGSLTEVQQYNPSAALVGGASGFDRYVIGRKLFQAGLGTSTILSDVVWIGADGANNVALEDLIDDILDGSGIAAAADAIPYVAVE